MALSITATAVFKASGTPETAYKAGETLAAGKWVILSTASPPVWMLADANGASTINGSVTTQQMGIALNGAASGQPAFVLTSGDITIGATVIVNMGYVLSGGAGLIAPFADLVALTGGTAYGVFIGFAISSTVIRVRFNQSGVATP